MIETTNTFSTTIVKDTTLQYLTFLPEQFDETKTYPLILFLHGSGERGNDLQQVKVNGVMDMISQPDFPFITVCPQCPVETNWLMHIDALNQLLDTIIETYPIDTNRIYLTGLSMGGHGTWDFAMLYPQRFAAIAPVCGRPSMQDMFYKLKDMPVWAFHGELDDVVPIEGSKRTVNNLLPINENVRYTYYPDANHNSWDNAYQTKELYEWFLTHSL